MPSAARTAAVPTVHIVDDEDSFRIAVGRLLQAAGYEVRGYASGVEFVRSWSARRRNAVACVLLDVHMPGLSGLDVQEELARTGEPPPLILLSGRGDVPMSVRAMKAGAVDFLTKPIRKDKLLKAVAMALAKDAEARGFRDKRHQIQRLYETLSPREQSVFEGIVSGKLNKQIAADLGAAERTIKVHRRQVLRKMKVDSVAALVHLAIQLRDNPGSQP